MTNEKFTLTWHSYVSHFQEVLGSLFDSGESSDVTLVCDDQVKFKAHTFVLKACSPVFKNILHETNELNSVVYLRGVNHLELRPILEFIYSGQASFYQERMKEFLRVGKDLQIKEIKEVPDKKEDKIVQENVDSHAQQHTIPEETFSDDTNNSNEYEGSSPAATKTSQQVYVRRSAQCPQCDAVFGQREDMLRHVRSKHEGVRYPCSQCDYQATQQSSLNRHVKTCKFLWTVSFQNII